MPPPREGDLRAPSASPIPIHDTAQPLLALSGILAALLERERSGRGQRVECTLLGTALALNAHSLVRLEDVEEPGTMRFSRAFYRAYRTSDGWIAVAALEPHFARALGEALEILPLDRARLAARFAAESAQHWEAWARARDLPIVALRTPCATEE